MNLDKMYRWIAYKMPNRLRYFTVIDGIVKATTGKYSNEIVTELKALEVAKRLEK